MDSFWCDFMSLKISLMDTNLSIKLKTPPIIKVEMTFTNQMVENKFK